MKYQAILFDMDGTLLDTLTDMQAAVNYILEKYGYPTRTLEEVRRFVGNGAGPLIHRALPQGVDPDREAEILADYRAYYQAHNCVETRPYDGIGPLLERLRQAGCKVAIVSNKPHGAACELAEQFFPGVPAFGESPATPRKPAPDMVLHALAALGAAMFYLTGYEQWQCTASSVPGMGFSGIAAAFLGGLHPIGTILASFFIQHITAGGAYVDKTMYCAQISDLISAIIIYLCGFVAFFKYFINNCIDRSEERKAHKKAAEDAAEKAGAIKEGGNK